MLTEDNDPTKPAGVLDNAGNVSSSTEASVQHPRVANNGRDPVYCVPLSQLNFEHL